MRKSFWVVCLGILFGAGTAGAEDSWTDKIKLDGDLRYRNETIKVGDNDTQNKHRIRVRIGIEAKVNEMLDLGFQLATGSDNPVSTNQTLGDGFSTKDIRLDLAYFDFHTNKAPGLHFIAGKMKNPYFLPWKSELVWDTDLRPEGGLVKYSRANKSVEFFTNIGGFYVEERSSDVDTYLFGAQA